MKQVQINNVIFPFDIGVKVLKHKNKDSKEFTNIEDIWDEVERLTIQDALSLRNIEQRRIAINVLGIEEVVNQLHGELVDRETITKTNMYINPQGELVNTEYNDTYELWKISGDLLWGDTDNNFRRNNNDVYFVKCKCTSTDREYLIWVDERGVRSANNLGWSDRSISINAIQSIAWTIQTRIPEGKIEKIIRQGDCIFVKPFPQYYEEEQRWINTRHLTEKEYRELLVAES
jgi:hypothetical protein